MGPHEREWVGTPLWKWPALPLTLLLLLYYYFCLAFPDGLLSANVTHREDAGRQPTSAGPQDEGDPLGSGPGGGSRVTEQHHRAGSRENRGSP